MPKFTINGLQDFIGTKETIKQHHGMQTGHRRKFGDDLLGPIDWGVEFLTSLLTILLAQVRFDRHRKAPAIVIHDGEDKTMSPKIGPLRREAKLLQVTHLLPPLRLERTVDDQV